MDKNEILHMVDHTLLAVDATWKDIRNILDAAMKYGTASACIPASYVKEAAAYVSGKIPVCTVIGFPNGYSTTGIKAAEAEDAIENGAGEIDMVINIGHMKDKKYDCILSEIKEVKKVCGNHILKIIIETCLLNKEEKIRACGIVTESGADYIKTSTGFSTGGATLEDIILMKKYVGPDVKIKAAGGISSFEDAARFIEAGASRLGTSRLVKLMEQF